MKTNRLYFQPFVRSVLLTLVVFVIPCSAQIRTDAGSNVSGTLTMTDGKVKKEITLKYVYAIYVFSGALMQIVLSDKPLPETYEERNRYIEVLSHEGRLNGLVIDVDARSKNVEGSTVYSELSLSPGSGTTQALGSSDARKQVFEAKVMNAKTVTATLYSTSSFAGIMYKTVSNTAPRSQQELKVKKSHSAKREVMSRTRLTSISIERFKLMICKESKRL